MCDIIFINYNYHSPNYSKYNRKIFGLEHLLEEKEEKEKELKRKQETAEEETSKKAKVENQ